MFAFRSSSKYKTASLSVLSVTNGIRLGQSSFYVYQPRGPQTVVSQPAAAPNIRVANSMTYGHCGNNLFELPSVFNNLAEAGNRNSGPKIRRNWKSIGKHKPLLTIYPGECYATTNFFEPDLDEAARAADATREATGEVVASRLG
jgi:hypothetical protein